MSAAIKGFIFGVLFGGMVGVMAMALLIGGDDRW